MALYPKARHRLLPENRTQSKIKPTQIIMHTAVDHPGPSDLFGFFTSPNVNVETHFFITFGGNVIQYMDTSVRADGNRYANRRPDGTGAISIETEDDGNPLIPWSSLQTAAIIDLCLWLKEEHDIPLKQIPSANKPGIGWHVMFGAPGPWTPSKGKTCPGPVRIAQFKEIISILNQVQRIDIMPITQEESRDLYVALHRVLLGREPDKAGLDFWVPIGVKDGAAALVGLFIRVAEPEVSGNRQRSNERSKKLEDAVIDQQARIEALEDDVSSLKAEELPPKDVDVDAVVASLVARLAE